MKTAKEIFEIFRGKWEISRLITHNFSGETYTANGYAEFARSGSSNTIKYTEKLRVQNVLDSEFFTSNQEYLYTYNNELNILEKYFSDERPFYTFSITESSGQQFLAYGNHLCNHDIYKAEYQFTTKESFSIKYTVNGPEKNYNIYTLYIRAH